MVVDYAGRSNRRSPVALWATIAVALLLATPSAQADAWSDSLAAR